MTPEREKEIRELRQSLSVFGPGKEARCQAAITDLYDALDVERAENAKLKEDFISWFDSNRTHGREFIKKIEDQNPKKFMKGILFGLQETEKFYCMIGSLVKDLDIASNEIKHLLKEIKKLRKKVKP